MFLLDRALPDPDVWHGNNLAVPDYAATYINLFGELWEDAHDARTALTYLWAHSEVQNALDRWIDLSRELARLAASEAIDDAAERRWQQLAKQRRSIVDDTLPRAAAHSETTAVVNLGAATNVDVIAPSSGHRSRHP